MDQADARKSNISPNNTKKGRILVGGEVGRERVWEI